MSPFPPVAAPGRTTVLVNLLWLVPGVVGGSEESTTDALRAVAELAPDDVELRLAVLRPFLHAHPDLADAFGCEVLDLDGRSKPRRVLAEQTWLPGVTRRTGAAVVHHAGGVVPFRHPGRVVLTVHDLQPLDLPRNFRPTKRAYIRAMAGRSARVADVVVVPSRFSRDRVVALLGVPPGRVEVVPWSVRATSAPPGTAAGAGTVEEFPLPPVLGSDPFLLYPAITYPHKNHLTLLDAFARVAAVEPDLHLVLTGGAASGEGGVEERLRRADLAGRVLRTGRVPASQLDTLFRHATGVVVPSRYEGFGLPVLEAMGREVPVLAADAGSLPEVAAPEDLVPATDVAAWADRMTALVREGPADRARRIARNRALAATFTPRRTAAGLLNAYRRAAGLRPDRDGPSPPTPP
ncbi:MAG: glycosyltransferase family 4 protein [Microthrixaceae bacterium]